jgi:hypothetical protein
MHHFASIDDEVPTMATKIALRRLPPEQTPSLDEDALK